MSILTARYPHSHRVERIAHTLPRSETTLAQHLGRAGYSTAAFVTWIYLSKKFGFGRGFDRFDELLPSSSREIDRSLREAVKAEVLVEHVSAWAQGNPRTPFFLFLHLYDPHAHYEPPLEYARMFDPRCTDLREGTYSYLSRHIKGLSRDVVRIGPSALLRVIALYDGEIRYSDTQLQRLFAVFERCGLLENSIVIFTSDHGEEFDEHGSMEGHQWTLYDEVLRIPLIICFPDDRYAGMHIKTVVESIDIAPTILAYLGLDIPDAFEGRNLLPLFETGAAAGQPRYTFSQIKRFNRKWAVRGCGYKLVYTEDTGVNTFGVPIVPGYELYDLIDDPGEQHNIWAPSLPVAQRLQATLNAWMLDHEPLQPVPAPELTPEELERLRSLGYVE
jgi:arylsulfatase A-like enzyme